MNARAATTSNIWREVKMKLLIAGSRSIGKIGDNEWNYDELKEMVTSAIRRHGLNPTLIISGGAKGPDRAGELYAEEHKIPLTVIKTNWKLGRGAGIINNASLEAAADAVLVLFDGSSAGTKNTIARFKKKGKPVYVA